MPPEARAHSTAQLLSQRRMPIRCRMRTLGYWPARNPTNKTPAPKPYAAGVRPSAAFIPPNAAKLMLTRSRELSSRNSVIGATSRQRTLRSSGLPGDMPWRLLFVTGQPYRHVTVDDRISIIGSAAQLRIIRPFMRVCAHVLPSELPIARKFFGVADGHSILERIGINLADPFDDARSLGQG